MASPKWLNGVAAGLLLSGLLSLTGCAGFSSRGHSSSQTTADFSVTVNPASVTVAKGGSASLGTTISAVGNFAGTVQLAITGAPAGVTTALTSNSVNGSGQLTLSVAASNSASAGSYTLTLWGASGSLSHSATIGVTVSTTTVNPDFTFSASPTSQTIAIGQSTSFVIAAAAENGFTGNISLSASGLPAGMTASFNPSAINSSGSSTLSISTNNSVAPGTYTLTLSGANGSLSHSQTVGVTVTQNNPPPDFSISASPGAQTITAGNSTSFTISVGAIGGFSGVVGLLESGMPAGMTVGCSPSSITGSGNCTLTVSTSSSTAAGTYTLNITGTSGTLTHSTSIAITVNAVVLPADFTLSASPSSQSVVAGKSTAITTTVAAQNGFTGSVTLTASGLPSGITASFAPASITTSGSSTLTLTSTNTTVAGTYTLTISGKSGSLSHTTNASLVVTEASVALNVLMPPGTTANYWYKDYPTYLFNNPTVNGATIAIEWAGSDQGPSAGSGQYDWTYPDAQIQAWVQAGKKVNFVVWANADDGSTTCGPESQYGSNNTGNCGIPTYVWTALGASNATTCMTQFGMQQMPNYLASAFQTNYRAFMAAMIQHYKNNASVGYIRFGLGHGGESMPVANWNDTTAACGQAYVTSWGLTISGWESYLSGMLNYEGSLNSPIQLMVGVTPMGNPGSTVPDYAAPIAVQNHIGFGSQGLELSDVNNCAGATADWCELFAQYSPQVPTELQTYMQSCPDNSCTTGSLVDLIPFAVANHVTVFEIYWQDWMVAFDPNFPGYYPAYAPVLNAAAEQ
ncbi:MAG TPA: hypothetical protein VMH04_21275 [Candidatus Solibacter sp.]|nr:hypothetical protein [Candidatus Solibacter sp.]